MERIIIHVDMDAFFASVEMRDDPSLVGKPLIIGSLPHERGVVSTCSYEARKYGVRSAMNIKEAYRLCPDGVFMHPNYEKYKTVSEQLHVIWNQYATASEYIALDEAYLDVARTAQTFERAREFAHEIKERTLNEIGLSCSVGVAYSKTAAKTASEEKKPDGYYEILSPKDFVDLIIDRDIRVLYSVGKRTEERLKSEGIMTVRDIREREPDVVRMLGEHGKMLVQLTYGIDDSEVTPYRPEDSKSVSREITFQEDVSDYQLLQDVLLLISISVVERARRYNLHGSGVSLKITYSDMKSITRSRTTMFCDDPLNVRDAAVDMLLSQNRRPVRLIGAGIFNLTNKSVRQLTLEDVFEGGDRIRSKELYDELERMGKEYSIDLISRLPDMQRNDRLHRIVEYMRIHRLR